ncbi:hypothetical protein SNE40_021619 [Patella caerulea]|uniref:C2H2-type domain-containing protein n=1 Tax=Patella caerulea TaxID=87958 RepID=A0AAN8G4T6_PATCE
MSDDEEIDEDVDLSVIKKAIKISGNMIEQILKGIHYGSPEVRCLLYSECDYILECKVCRNLFRSLPNFVAHKRAYCQSAYQESETFFNDLKPDEETIIVQPEAPETSSSTCSQKRSKPRTLESTIKLLKDGILGKSEAYKVYSKAADKMERQKEFRKTQTLTFEPIPNTTKAMKVTVSNGEPVESVVENDKSASDQVRDTSTLQSSPPTTLQSSPTATLKSMLLKSALEGDGAVSNSHTANPASSGNSSSLSKSHTKSCPTPTKMTSVISPPKKMTLRCKEGINSMPWKKARKEDNEPDSPERGMDFRNLLCLDCNTAFRSRKTLIFHYQNAHCGQRTFFPCPFCKSVFFYIFGLTRHLMRNHSKSKAQVDKMRAKLKKSAFVKQVTEQCQSARQQIHHVKELDAEAAKKLEIALDKQPDPLTSKLNVKREVADIIQCESYSSPTKDGEHICSNCGRSFGKKISLLNHRKICLTTGMDGDANNKAKSDSTTETKKPIIKTTGTSVTSYKKIKSSAIGKRFSSRSTSQRLDYAKMISSGISSNSEEEDTSTAQMSPESKEKSPVEKEKTEDDKSVVQRYRNHRGQFVGQAAIPASDKQENRKNKDEKENTKEDKDTGTEMEVDDAGQDVKKKVRVVEEIWVDKQPGRPTEKIKSNRTYVMKASANQKLECQDTKKVTAIVNETELHCMHCDQEFSNVSNLRRHAIRHLGWKRYKCKMCKFSSYNKSECNTHLYRTHSDRFRNVSSVNSLIVDLGKEGSRVRLRKKQQTLIEKQAIEFRLSPTQHIRKQNRKKIQKNEDPSPRKSSAEVKEERNQERPFNISTRNSPREFDTRPYQKIDRATTLCTRKSSYPKKITLNTQTDDSDEDDTRSNLSHTSANSKSSKLDSASIISDVSEQSAKSNFDDNKMEISDTDSEATKANKQKCPKMFSSRDPLVTRRSARANETGKCSPLKPSLANASKSIEEPELKAIKNLTKEMMD